MIIKRQLKSIQVELSRSGGSNNTNNNDTNLHVESTFVKL